LYLAFLFPLGVALLLLVLVLGLGERCAVDRNQADACEEGDEKIQDASHDQTSNLDCRTVSPWIVQGSIRGSGAFRALAQFQNVPAAWALRTGRPALVVMLALSERMPTLWRRRFPPGIIGRRVDPRSSHMRPATVDVCTSHRPALRRRRPR